ncbi:hypothetical protein SAMN02927903_00748 [Flavobacterium caeni]|uniref:DUF2194 domain-containing protein n=2 Tax=Flavobacterium caeni TaxID=490189 RepID=A0A1G5D4V3_9FLAO|nr:hypothetical protein SAMN02927903_00748 [Flavobacterium caeni]
MALLVLFAFGLSGCEGLDDWSDLQESAADLFDSDSEAKSEGEFIRYGEVPMSAQPLVEYLVDPTMNQSKFYGANIQKSCDYTKIPFRSVNIQSFAAPAATTRVVALLDTKKLSDAAISNLMDFVAKGGTLFIPFASEDHRMAFLYGFRPEAEFDTDTKSKGYRYTTPMLPTIKNLTNYETVPFYGFAQQNFSDKVKVLATAYNNPKYPAVVENPIGKGRVILYNTSVYASKQDRGFIFAGVLKGLDGIPYPIANASTVFLDDFPSPLYNIMAEPIASEMNLNMSDFVTKVWWPDMIKLGKEFNIKYAAMIAFDYKNKTSPPFVFDQWNSTKIKTKNKVEPISDWIMRDVVKNGHELAFHGYNHVSLTTKEWKNQEFIGLAFQSVQKKWEAGNFGPLPVTYVPPSNIIDKHGVDRLQQGMPSIKYMCSLYLGELHEGGAREFDYDPFNKELFDYPRISSGFYMNNEEKYILHSEYLLTGIWNHFVHPDDVFQIPATANATAGHFDLRNRLSYGWHNTKGKDKAMLPEFRKYLKEMTTTFPQLRFVKGGEGGKLTIRWRASRYKHKAQNGLYTVVEQNPEDEKQYWFMYGSPANAGRIDAQLKGQNVLFSKTIFMDGYLYSVYSNKQRLTSIDVMYKSPQQKVQLQNLLTAVRADFAQYKELVKKFNTGAMWVDNSEKELKAELAALKKRMLSEPKIDSVAWNKYAKYLSWEDRGEEVWKMLDEHVIKYPTAENVMYSKELDRVIGYPNDITKEKWMRAQMLVTPNDKDLLNSYVANFYTDENQENIRKALKQLLSIDTSQTNYKNYIAHLLQYDPPAALQELSDKKATDEFGNEMATSITWLFADNNDFAKAYEWSKFSTEVDFVTKMNWLIELKDWKTLEREYASYIAEHPEDYKAKALMASVYHEQGRFKEAWVLANSLPESPEKEELRKTLNIDVVYEKPEMQEDLIANHHELFYPNVLKQLAKENRLARGNYVDLDSYYETNQDDPSIFKNRVSYNFYDKKSNIHSIGLTYSQYYKLEARQYSKYNEDNSLKGIEYKFQNAIDPDVEGKIQYWGRARFELDDHAKGYYEAGLGANRFKNKMFSSAEFQIMPVETAAGMNQGIYNARMSLHHDMFFFKRINASLSVEGNYYTDGLLKTDTITVEPPVSEERPHDPEARRTQYEIISPTQYTVSEYDDAMEVAATLRLAWDNGEEKKSKFVPFLEGQYSVGSRDQSTGIPYWMIDNRMYGGGGLGWSYGLGDFRSKVEAAHFFDDYSGNFQRYNGTIQYQLFDFTAIMLNFEFFAQDKYYSNTVQLGIKYNLKKKVKKKK